LPSLVPLRNRLDNRKSIMNIITPIRKLLSAKTGSCLTVLILLTQSLSAASYYVSSSSGSDANAGTSSVSPWKTIGKVNAVALQSGDHVYLKGGDTFTDAGLVFLSNDLGTEANPIVIDSYGTGRATLQPPYDQHGVNVYDTGGLTVRNLNIIGPGPASSDGTPRDGVSLYSDLTGGVRKSGLRFENLAISQYYDGISIGAVDSSYSGFQNVTVTGCTVTSCLSDGITSYGYYPGTSTKQSHKNIQILNTTVSQCYGDPTLTAATSGSGIVLSATLGGLIDSCIAHDNGGGDNDTSGGGPVGIWCWSCDSVVIQHCLVYNQKTTPGCVDGGGFDIDGAATNCTVQYCYSYNNQGPGYEVIEFQGAPTLNNATVRYNISWLDGRAGESSLSVWNGNTTSATCNGVKFYNNTVVSSGSSNPTVSLLAYSGTFSAAFYNNIFITRAGAPFVKITYDTTCYTFNDNLYYSADGTQSWIWGTSTYTSLAAWRAASGHPETRGGTSLGYYGNPLLNAPLTGYSATSISGMASMTAFVPGTGSPVINAGLNLNSPTYGNIAMGNSDFRGDPIPNSAYDIGAYEIW